MLSDGSQAVNKGTSGLVRTEEQKRQKKMKKVFMEDGTIYRPAVKDS